LRHALTAALASVAALAVIVIVIAYTSDQADTPPLADTQPEATLAAGEPLPTAAALSPETPSEPMMWMDLLETGQAGEAVQLACLDANGDGRLDSADGARFAGLDIELWPDRACENPDRADLYEGVPAGDFACGEWLPLSWSAAAAPTCST
jgi:hypothetical protein